jgi:hypothetical protein
MAIVAASYCIPAVRRPAEPAGFMQMMVVSSGSLVQARGAATARVRALY